MSNIWKDIHIYGTVKVGERGQIVIPSEARKEFNIEPGDLLLVASAPGKGGIGLVKADSVKEILEKVMKGLGQAREAQT